MKQDPGISPAIPARQVGGAVPGVYPLVLSLLLLLVSAPLVTHPTHFLYPRGGQATDLTITHWPAMTFNAQSLHEHGQIPLWRTTIASGGPWIANPQSWLTYPPAWLSLVLPPIVALNLLLMGHLVMTALATYALARRALGMEPSGAALAGLALASAPWISGQLSAGHLNIVFALAWLPVAFGALYRVARQGDLSAGLLAGVAWAAAVVSHIQTAMFVVMLTTAWFVFVLLRHGAPVQHTGRRVSDSPTEQSSAGTSTDSSHKVRLAGPALVVPLVSVLLSAVLLIPLAEALPHLNRTELSVEEAGVFSVAWPQLLTTLIPTYGGEPEQVVYLGLPILLLAAIGLALPRDATTWFLAASAALAALFALGTHAPLFPLLARLVPGIGWLRVPARAWMVVAFAVSLLAGRGLDALVKPRLGPAERRRVTFLALVALVVGLALAAGLALIQRPIPPAVATLVVLTVLAVAAILLGTRAVVPRAALIGTAIVLVAVDAGAVRLAWTEMVPADEAFSWGAQVGAYLANQTGLFRIYSPDYSVPQHIAVENDLYLADAVDPIQLRPYAEFLAEAGGYGATEYSPSMPPVHGDLQAQLDTRLLGLLNVRYVVARYPIEAEGLALHMRSGDSYIYENAHALPHAFATSGSGLADRADAAQVAVARYSPNEIVIKARVEQPGLLVLSEVCYPGWQARIDGIGSPVVCVKDLFRAVEIDRGVHTIVFQYRPWSVWLGTAISAATLAALLGCAGCQAWRSR